MRVPDAFVRSVVFIGYAEQEDDEERFVPVGSAFLVASNISGQRFDHLVTAAHNIEEIAALHKRVEIRVNQKGRDCTFADCDPGDWVPHEDKTVDVAVLPVRLIKLSVATDTLEVSPIPLDTTIVNDEVAAKTDFMAGSPIAVVGLFLSHPGQTQNLPIARQGTIALMRDPDNPIHTQQRGFMDAYLAEVRSLDGLSGAPVFLLVEPYWIGADRKLHRAADGMKLGYLLGLMHGHYQLPPKPSRVTDKTDPDDHAGIGVVVPVDKIIETIERMELKEARMATLEQINRRSKQARVREDKASRRKAIPKPERKADDERTHRDRFTRLLGAAVKRPKSSD